MGSSKAPKTPDYTGAAIAQGQADRQTAIDLTNMNRVNQVDPYGQTTWSQNLNPADVAGKAAAQARLDDYNRQVAANPRWAQDLIVKDRAKFQSDVDSYGNKPGAWTQTTTLTPAQQALLEQQQGLQGQQNSRIQDLLTNFQTPTLGAQRTLAPQRDLGPQRQLKEANQNDIQNLLYGQITKQYGDRFAKDEAAQRASLANQGFQMGSEGYQNTLNDLSKSQNSAYQDAATQAALSSYDQMNTERGLNQSEYSTLAGDDLNRFSALSADDLNRFGAQSSDDLNRYNSQMGFLSQLLGGVQGPTTPSYQPYAQATQYQSPDLMGAMQGTYQGDLNKTNAQNAGKSNTMATVGTLAAAAAVAF